MQRMHRLAGLLALVVACESGGTRGSGGASTDPTDGGATTGGETADTRPSSSGPEPTSTSPTEPEGTATTGDGGESSSTGSEEDLVVWPNAESRANSDPWIAEHHQEIERMRPRVLAINYVNARTMDEMAVQLDEMIAVIAEASRYHGFEDASAPAFLEYELAYAVDLRDASPPSGWPYRNSTLYPREDPVEGAWGFDYEALFSAEYADLLGIENPDAPGESLTLCEAIDHGLVHEVWVYGDADVPDVSAAEMLELKPHYDENFTRLAGPMNACAGNGCFDEEDIVPCTRSVRVAWFNNTRGPGCFLESLSHAFEGMGRKGWSILPYLSRYFPEFSGMRLDDEYGLPIENWYSCPYGAPCLSYPSSTSVSYEVSAEVQGTIENYDPVCGNVHWPPNGTQHYDLQSTATVQTSCLHWRDGSGGSSPYDGSEDAMYAALAPDCMGAFLVWWRQNIPGLNNVAVDDDGLPMRNWWPFMFY
jgi:hypothetical protein